MLNSSLQSMFDDYKPVNKPIVRVHVDLNVDNLTKDLANAIFAEMIRVSGPVGECFLQGLDAELIRKYLATEGWLRRCKSVDLTTKMTSAYRHLMRSVAVPTLWYQALICIGRAIDRDYSIEFIPNTAIEETDLLEPSEMERISSIMFGLQNSGLRLVAGIPTAAEGELAFMAMCHAENVVTSHRRSDHGTFAFLASFFKSEETSIALGSALRVVYGFDSDYRSLISRVVSSSGGWER